MVTLVFFAPLGILGGCVLDAVTVHFSAMGVWAIGVCVVLFLFRSSLIFVLVLTLTSFSFAWLGLAWAVGFFGVCRFDV